MGLDLIPLLSFVLITTYTPGPNNISSTSMGVRYGYRRSLRYLLGITTGFFLVMLLCGLISGTLTSIFPSFEIVLRIVGAVYILWLAYETLRATYTFEDNVRGELGFVRGALLQILNPKGVIYGLTLYSTFLLGTAGKPTQMLLSAAGLAATAFSAVSTWALFGSAIRRFLHVAWLRQMVNAVLALLLIYTAVEVSGVLDLITGA